MFQQKRSLNWHGQRCNRLLSGSQRALLAAALLLTLPGQQPALGAAADQSSVAEARARSAQAETVPAMNFERLTQLAREHARKPHEAYQHPLPESLQSLSYDQYRAIRFDPQHALWREKALFEVQFFHPGFIYKEGVDIHTLDVGGRPSPYPYQQSHFILGKPVEGLKVDPNATPGYAGFRVHYPLNTSDYKDEVAVFQGASYFRLVGPGQVYGLSARGLAVDTAETGGEEFPRFSAFWLQPPAAQASTLVFFALLESPSVTGAYRFELQPGLNTELMVTARLFARQDINKLGLAPLTSMYLFGENSTGYYDDFRPEVHDSDGLLIHNSQGEWIWRPLNNPASLRVVSFQDDNPRGFGLLQRDRRFEHYLDAEADYHRRPGFWVEPLGDWGRGRVELVEIPTDSETNDNIVAYWVPREPVKAGAELDFRYRVTTVDRVMEGTNLAWVQRTRNGWAHVPGTEPPPITQRHFVVDFAGDAIKRFAASQAIKPELKVSGGTVSDLYAVKIVEENLWRVSFKVALEPEQPADMRLFLSLRGKRISEVWNYVWSTNNLPE
ncbi:MAG: glucan biosynthesis protein D [Pseudomonadales bacterium]|nr:glucan biosynthesis protein D [Pseudomonadales bacterium]